PEAEGRSMLPLVAGDDLGWRDDFLVESARYSHVPSYCGVRTERYLYVVYETGEEELYDLVRDPSELQNAAADPTEAATRSRRRPLLPELSPPPPPGLASPP